MLVQTTVSTCRARGRVCSQGKPDRISGRLYLPNTFNAKHMRRLSRYALFALALAVPASAFCSAPLLNRAFVSFTDYKKIEDNVYADPSISDVELRRAVSGLQTARHRIGDFYGPPIAKAVTIIPANASEGRKFGLTDVPGTAFISMTGTHVMLNMEQFSLDVTSHELMHAELAERLGYWARLTRLPTWFDEGVALQLDRRPQYLIDCAAVGQDEMRRVKSLATPRNFWSADKDQNIRNYQAAKCAVAELLEHHPPKSLYYALSRLRQGEHFADVFPDD
jgi:hypothetical protein